MFCLLVDAGNGDVWLRRCLTRNLSDATYRVFASDSPSPFSPGHASPAHTQPPIAERCIMTFSALDTNASPRGWIEDGINETRGNNVDAYLDWDGDEAPDLPRPAGAPFRCLDFPLDLSSDPHSYGPASVTQLFYWCNWMHDRLYQLGFTESAGNFQNDNLGRGGMGNDALLAAAQHGGYLNNAMISVPPEGMPPLMEMFLFDSPEPDRDSALDAEVVLHEYAHGLTDRLVGGGVGLSAWQSAGLGEGWSDFYALALLSEPGDDLDGAYAHGAYLSYRLDGLTENYYFGIRRYPCSTDLAKNPLTFKDIDPGQADPHAGVPLCPRFQPFSRYDAEEVHCQGEVWCAVLWQARANLVRKHGFAIGNPLALQLITDGLRLAPPNPDFVQARDAILLADVVNNQGANLGDLWRAFAKRGLGLEAASPGSWSPYDVSESYSAPGQLIVFPSGEVESSGPIEGPFTPTAEVFQVNNAGAGALSWAAGQTGGWLALSPASGFIPVGGQPTRVQVALNPCVNLLPPGCYTNTLGFTNLATGDLQTRQWVLRVGQPDPLTQWFRAGDLDLGFRSLTFMPATSPASYAVCVEPASELPVDPLGGRRLWVGDDGSAEVHLSGTNTVCLYEMRTNVFFVNGNGSLTLGEGDPSYIETLDAHFSTPRISVLFNDFDTEEGGGNVGVRELEDRVVVTYLDVCEVPTATIPALFKSSGSMTAGSGLRICGWTRARGSWACRAAAEFPRPFTPRTSAPKQAAPRRYTCPCPRKSWKARASWPVRP